MSNEWLLKWDPRSMCLHSRRLQFWKEAQDSAPGLCYTGVLRIPVPGRRIPKCDSQTFFLLWVAVIPFENSCDFLSSREVLIGIYQKKKADECLCVNCRTSTVSCWLHFWGTLACVRKHIPAVFALYYSVSKLLSSFSKYCYFNYFRHVWSSPAVGSERLVLT